MADSDTINIALIIILILINAYFVALEFATVQIRASRLDTMISEGNKRAIKCKKIKDNLNSYLSATQLGITLVGLLLGWIGEPSISRIVEPMLKMLNMNESTVATVSIIIAFSLITMLEVVLGELVPKAIALFKAEELTMKLADTLILFHKLTYPIIWAFDHLTDICLKPFGLQQSHEVEETYTKMELEMLVEKSLKDKEEKGLLAKAFKFGEVVAEDIMVHRLDMVCISHNSTQEEVLKIITDNGFTRYPVTSEDKDHIIGYLHVRDIYRDIVADNVLEMDKCIRDIKSFPEGMELTDIFMELKKGKEQIAIIVDEQGGTSGLLTLEDIIEQLVGNIADEFDEPSENED